ncbi:hypothetical protein L204_100647 [Cryptococcus depauperatus]|nr:hypothetical protein L204_01422 [Cryptococcus depauperatus CBS 7855]
MPSQIQTSPRPKVASSYFSESHLSPRPHPQIDEPIPACKSQDLENNDLEAEGSFYEETPLSGPQSPFALSDDVSEYEDAVKSSDKWQKWRSSSPWWIYPVIVGAALTIGMAAPPKSEIFIELACRANLPQITNGDDGAVLAMANGIDSDNYRDKFKILDGFKHSAQDMVLVDRSSLDEEEADKEEIDIRLCKKNPKVQAVAAKLTMVLLMTMGILSALTSGFWGQASDRLGRTKVMASVMFGLLVAEVNFIFVSSYPKSVPGGYYAFIVGPVVEGLLGGFAAIMATVNAYLSDVTEEGKRVIVFARMAGFMMAGFAVGPALGSLLISSTGYLMIPFYVNIVVQLFLISYILLFLPESLTSSARTILAKKATLSIKTKTRSSDSSFDLQRSGQHEGSLLPEERSELFGNRKSNSSFSTRLFDKILSVLHPLRIFTPVTYTDVQTGLKKRNWNLMAVGTTAFLMNMLIGVLQIKVQYALFAFGWTPSQLGPYISGISATKCVVLMGIVPIIMRFIRPRFGIEAASSSKSFATRHRSARLDLFTVRFCLVIEFIPWLLLAFGISEGWFIFLSALLSVGAPSLPATNSLAVSILPDPSQAGRLFGALSVTYALGATIIGPLFFGTVFAWSVGWWSEMIFGLGAACVAAALGCMATVRLRDIDWRDL